MSNIVKFKRPRPSERHKDRILCERGFHKWKIVTAQKFDVKQGRLVTAFKCQRCGAVKNEAR